MVIPMIYADEDGRAHFKDVDLEEKLGKVVYYPHTTTDWESATEFSFRRLGPKLVADWHPALIPHIAVVMSGEMEMEDCEGQKRHFKAGDAFIQGDVSGQGHIFRVGEEGCLLFNVNISMESVYNKI